MRKLLQTSAGKDAAVRIACDYVLVHICMLAALSGSIYYHLIVDSDARVKVLAARFGKYYAFEFFILSLVFPLIFLLNGVYTHCRSYQRRYKTLVVVRSTLVAVLAFLCADYFLFRYDLVPRSAVMIFS